MMSEMKHVMKGAPMRSCLPRLFGTFYLPVSDGTQVVTVTSTFLSGGSESTQWKKRGDLSFRENNWKNLKKIVDARGFCAIIRDVYMREQYIITRSVILHEGLKGGREDMSNVIVKENETLDSALRRFKRSCAKAGIQQEIRKREHYEKPSVRRKKKSEAARKRKYN